MQIEKTARWSLGSCTLTEQKLNPENQNNVHNVSLILSEMLERIGRFPISECRELPNWDKVVHVVKDPEIQKLFQTFHRYGYAPSTDEKRVKGCPFQEGELRERFTSLIGENNLIANYERESEVQRRVLQSFFTSKRRGSFEVIWKEVAGKWVDEQKNLGEVLLFDATLKLVSECLIKGILGYTKCNAGDIELNAGYWNDLLAPKKTELKTVKEYELEGKPGYLDQALGFLQDSPDLFTKLYVYGIETYDLDELTQKIYDATLFKQDSLCNYLKIKNFTEKMILENIKGFLLAGQETVGHLLGFILYEYAKSSEMQKDAQNPQNIRRAYLETLRLYSVAGVQREAGCDMVLTYPNSNGEAKEHYIRKGDFIACIPIISGHDPEKWDNPETFDSNRPDIWNVLKNPHFGSGAHRCIGEKLAEFEIITILKEVLSKAVLSTNDSLPDLLNAFTLRPKHDISVSFKSREI